MRAYLRMAIKFIYAIIEQFIFYLAAIIGFLSLLYFGNAYLAISVFFIIFLSFWALSTVIKQKK
jgi:hypothetical protein